MITRALDRDAMSDDAAVVCIRRAPADISHDVDVKFRSGLDDSVAAPESRSPATATGATWSAVVCRRLQFDVDDRPRSSTDSSARPPAVDGSPDNSPRDAVLEYLERLYDDKVARWNMDFRTMTPLIGGRWRWSRATRATSPSLPTDDRRLPAASPGILTKTKHRGQMNGERSIGFIKSINQSISLFDDRIKTTTNIV